MSKLFDTLEKIRLRETGNVPQSPGAPLGQDLSRPNRKTRLLVGACIAGVGVMLVAAAATFLSRQPHSTNSSVKNASKASTASKSTTQSLTPAIALKVPTANPMPHEQQTAQPQPTALKEITAKATLSPDQITALNNQGVEAIRAKQDYWKGLYLLNQVKENDPSRIEALINMAVALNELGLTGPANRYMAEAYAINPRHPALQLNLDILARAGQLDGTMRQ